MGKKVMEMASTPIIPKGPITNLGPPTKMNDTIS